MEIDEVRGGAPPEEIDREGALALEAGIDGIDVVGRPVLLEAEKDSRLAPRREARQLGRRLRSRMGDLADEVDPRVDEFAAHVVEEDGLPVEISPYFEGIRGFLARIESGDDDESRGNVIVGR